MPKICALNYSKEFLMPRISKRNLFACQFFVVQKRQSQLFFSFSVGVLSFRWCYYCSFPLPLLLRRRPHVSRLDFRRSLPSERGFICRTAAGNLANTWYDVRSWTKSILTFHGPANTSSLRKLFFKVLSAFFVWRRFHVFRSCRSFVSSYCLLRVTTGLSSCREIFLSL